MRAFAHSFTGLVTVAVAMSSLAACASKGSYDTAVSRGDSLQADNAQLQAANARLQGQYDSLQNLFSDEMQSASLDMELLRDGIEIELPSDLVFESASLQLKADGKEFGTKLVNYLKGNEYLVFVTGYTDSQNPIGNLAQRYPTNWELSAARAALAVRYMVGEGLMAKRMWAIGRADQDPLASNSTADGRAENRRLRIVLRPPELVGSTP